MSIEFCLPRIVPVLVLLHLMANPAWAQAGTEREPGTNWFERPAWMRDDATRHVDSEQFERLDALGYLDGYVPPAGESGVTRYDPRRTQAGHNLHTSGHGPFVYLSALNGKELHRWEVNPRIVWPGIDVAFAERGVEPANYIFFAHLFPDGKLLALFSGLGLVMLDSESRVLWSFRGGAEGAPGAPHHHFDIMSSGEIVVLDHITQTQTVAGEERMWREDHIVTLTGGGVETARFSLSGAFSESDYAPLLAGTVLSYDGTPQLELHTNFIQVLDGALASAIPAFRAGNLLVSCRDINALAVVDMDTRKVVWASTGLWLRQHSPTILPSGNILVFDNQGASPGIAGSRHLKFQGTSRIIEFDPRTQEVAWIYRGSDTSPFDCHKMGFCWRFPNGNTLINDTVSGRAFEVTAGKEIVWEWVNPHRAGDKGQYIASVPFMRRLPPDFPLDWASVPSG